MAGYAAKAAAGFFHWAGSASKVRDSVRGIGSVGKDVLPKLGGMAVSAVSGFMDLGKSIFELGLKPMASLTGIGMKLTSLAFGAGEALASVASLGQAMAAMSGIVLIAPVALATLAGVVGVIILGLDGIKKAFAGFPQAIAPLRKEMSDIFEKTMAPGVKILEQALPKLHTGLGSLASGLGGLFTAFSKAFAAPKTLALFNDSLKNMGGFFKTLSAAAQPFMHAIATLVNVGSKGMGSFAKTLVDLAKQFDNFITKAAASGQLQEWIHNAIEAFKTFGKVSMSVFRFMMDTFKAMKPAIATLAPLFSAIGSVISKSIAPILSDIVVTMAPAVIEFINALGSALDVARPGIVAFAQGFATLIKALAPVMPAIGRLVGVLGDQLGKALTAMAPILSEIIGLFANELADVLPIIIPPMVEIAKIFGQMWIALAPIIKPLAELVSVVLKAFADILAAIIPPLAEFVTQLVTMLAPFIPPLVDAFMQLFDAVKPLIKPLLDLTVKVFQALSPLLGPIADLLSLIATILTPLAYVLAGIITALGWVIDHVASAIGGIADFISNAWGGIMEVTTGMDQTVHTALTKPPMYWNTAAGQMKKTSDQVLFDMTLRFLGFSTDVKDTLGQIGTANQSMYAGMSSDAAQAFASVIVWSKKAFGVEVPAALNKVGTSALSNFAQLKAGAAKGSAGAQQEVHVMGDQTKAWLDGMGESLYGSGQSATKGFADGMSSSWALAEAEAAAQDVVQHVKWFFPSSPAKKGPFSGMGWTPHRGRALVEGFAQGIVASAPAAAAAAERVMRSVASPFEDGFNTGGIIDSATKGLDSKFNDVNVATRSTIDSMIKTPDGFSSIGDQITAAISDWQVAVDVNEKAVGKMAKKYDTRERRRR
jgi:phage-related protein